MSYITSLSIHKGFLLAFYTAPFLLQFCQSCRIFFLHYNFHLLFFQHCLPHSRPCLSLTFLLIFFKYFSNYAKNSGINQFQSFKIVFIPESFNSIYLALKTIYNSLLYLTACYSLTSY